MGGIGFIASNRTLCMLNVLVSTHLLMAAHTHRVAGYFYASSACVYPTHLQENARVLPLAEDSVYPAQPEDGYGWEKLFSERLCQAYASDFGLKTRVFRFHNVYGPYGAWFGGREKAPAAICRKIIEAKLNGSYEIELWGDGEQTRSFMYVDDCVLGVQKLMASHCSEPLNLGRSELVTINQLATIVEEIAGFQVKRRYRLDAPQGVRGRNSDNTKILNALGWEPSTNLNTGLRATYAWVEEQVTKQRRGEHVIS
jgi:nucleoside-diphosphate-sugar epimerase